ncbi:IS6 family transposase (plasmid) [Deinococcus wulumuqiensis R12]|nr:IS6 family transposase [Deinococcus wulumuqiensis R12]
MTSEETKQPYASPVQERPEEPEIDLGLLWQGVWRRLPIIFLASLLIGGGAYFWAKSQPKVYEASATLLVTNTSAQQPEGFLTGLGSAPPLPDGVVAKVVRSPQVLGVVIQELQASSSLEVQERTRLVNALRDELRLQNLKTLTLSGSGNLTLIGCRAVTDRKPYRHRFPLSVIGYALRLYHRFPLSQRDVQELLHERGVQVSHETLRQWNIKFAPLLTEELRHREPRRGSRWHLDEVCVKVGGVKHWLWRAVDEYGDVLDILLQEHRDTQAAKSFFVRLLGEYDVPEVIHTDKLWSYGAALREIPVLHDVEHVQVVSTARCNNLVEQSHRPTRQQERGQLGFKRRKRTQEFLALHARVSNLHRHTRTTVPATLRRSHQSAALLRWREAMQQVA